MPVRISCIGTIVAVLMYLCVTGGASGQSCGDVGSGDCCDANGIPGCDDLACCEAVCSVDSFCCDTGWDSICVGEACELCCCADCTQCGFGVCPGEGGDCCAANGSPGCDDVACCEGVCMNEPFCCDVQWDSLCADAAADERACDCGKPCPWDLDGTGSVGVGDMLVLLKQWGSPGDADFDGSGAVGVSDLLELLGAWGGCPVNAGCGSADAGDCCVGNGGPFCNDLACCESVCAADPFCCEIRWDNLCAAAAQKDPNCNCDVPG